VARERLGFDSPKHLRVIEVAKRRGNKQLKEDRVDPFVVANIQPFATGARGAKVPDENMLPSVAKTLGDRLTLTADANGYAAVAIRPALDDAICSPAAISAGGVITWDTAGVVSATDITGRSAIATEFGPYRIAACGVMLQYEGRSDEKAGSVLIAQVPEFRSANEFSFNVWPTTEAEMARCPEYHDMTLTELAENSLTVPLRVVDPKNLHYRNLGENRVATSPMDYGGHAVNAQAMCVVLISGATPGSSVQIRMRYHVELLAYPTLSSLFDATKAAKHEPAVLRAIQRLHSAASVSRGDNHWRHVSDGLSQILSAEKGGFRRTALKVGKDFAVQYGPQIADRVLPFLAELIL
jgi:hypothetical protein